MEVGGSSLKQRKKNKRKAFCVRGNVLPMSISSAHRIITWAKPPVGIIHRTIKYVWILRSSCSEYTPEYTSSIKDVMVQAKRVAYHVMIIQRWEIAHLTLSMISLSCSWKIPTVEDLAAFESSSERLWSRTSTPLNIQQLESDVSGLRNLDQYCLWQSTLYALQYQTTLNTRPQCFESIWGDPAEKAVLFDFLQGHYWQCQR